MRLIRTAAALACGFLCWASTASSQTHIIRIRSDVATIDRTVPYPLEQVRAALPAAFQELGLPAGLVRGSDVDFMTPYLQAQGRLFNRPLGVFLDCGAANFGFTLGPQTVMTLAMVTHLDESGSGGTILRTQIDAYAVNRNTSPDPTYCASRGVIEELLTNALLRILGQGA